MCELKISPVFSLGDTRYHRCWILQPFEREERSSAAAQFVQSDGRPVLPRIGAELAQDERVGNRVLLN